MTRKNDVNRLQILARVVLDQRLNALKQASDQLQRSHDQLAAINAAAAPANLPAVAAGIVDVTYQRWADIRRAELNVTIARQTASFIDARTDAGQAFGRTRALEGALAQLMTRK